MGYAVGKAPDRIAYIRRYKSDLKSSIPTFFNSVQNKGLFEEHILNNKGNTFLCDGETCGYAMTLSTAQDLKSSNYDKVTTIIFDEFIIDEGQKKYYLHNEVETFLNLIETIARMRKIRVILLGNAGNVVTNPYFLYFDLFYNIFLWLFVCCLVYGYSLPMHKKSHPLFPPFRQKVPF